MMLKILCLFSVLTFSQAGVLKFEDPKIVNGENVKEGEIPYQVSLQYKEIDFHFCGGSILNEDYVITAAHCLEEEEANLIQVFAGTTNLQNRNATIHNVKRIIVHEKYNPDTVINDIALLEVEPAFTKDQFVALPSKDELKPGDEAIVSGWGNLWKNGPSTDKLKKAKIRISNQFYCLFLYGIIGFDIHKEQVCAFDQNTERGSCNGDSGGPLTVNGELVGLVSVGVECGSTTFPTVFTRVVKYLDWINSNII